MSAAFSKHLVLVSIFTGLTVEERRTGGAKPTIAASKCDLKSITYNCIKYSKQKVREKTSRHVYPHQLTTVSSHLNPIVYEVNYNSSPFYQSKVNNSLLKYGHR